MTDLGRSILVMVAALCFVLQAAPGVVAAFDEADELASFWPFDDDLVVSSDSSSSDDSFSSDDSSSSDDTSSSDDDGSSSSDDDGSSSSDDMDMSDDR